MTFRHKWSLFARGRAHCKNTSCCSDKGAALAKGRFRKTPSHFMRPATRNSRVLRDMPNGCIEGSRVASKTKHRAMASVAVKTEAGLGVRAVWQRLRCTRGRNGGAAPADARERGGSAWAAPVDRKTRGGTMRLNEIRGDGGAKWQGGKGPCAAPRGTSAANASATRGEPFRGRGSRRLGRAPPTPPPRTETCGVLVTDGKHTSAQQKPRQWYHRRLSALQ